MTASAETIARTKLAAKKIIVRAICHQRVGDALAFAYRDLIPSRGFIFDTSASAVPRFVVPRLFWGFYEKAEIDFVTELLDPNLDVIELGSCIGVVSTHVASRLDAAQKLVCVEANPALVATIRENIRRNVPSRVATVVNAALGDGEGETIRFSVAADAVSSRVGGGAGSIEVPAISLEELIAAHEIGDYTLICDIEGAEQLIIESPAGTLAGCRMFIVEMHPGTYADGDETLRALESRLAEVHGLRRVRRRGDVYCFAR